MEFELRAASRIVLLLAVLGLSGCGSSNKPIEKAESRNKLPVAPIEDGTPANKKNPDKVTAEARKFFAEWLRDHGEESIVNDESGVGITGSPTRLWAFLYGSNEKNGVFNVETEFRIQLPDGREVVEFVAGSGPSEEAAIGASFLNFTLSTFHVVYSCFMNSNDKHMSHERVTIEGSERVLTTGGMFAMGGDDTPEFTDVSQQIRDEICKTDLSDHVHWVKVVYGQHERKMIVQSVTLNNGGYPGMEAVLSRLKWPPTDSFYMAKQFIVIRPAASVSK